MDHKKELMIDVDAQSNSRASSSLQYLLFLLSAMVTLAALVWVLWYCHFGLDVTDESYYLVWMSNPHKYSVSATQFGFLYHPLYEGLNGNIALLRQVNFLITFSLAWWLGNVILNIVYGEKSINRIQRIIFSAAIAVTAATSLVFAGLWLPTPSYNSLAFQALLVAAIGLILTNREDVDRYSIVGAILIGIGGWLSFMAKPTSAMALGLCTVFYFALSGRLRMKLIAISVFVALSLVVVSALYIDGSITAFIERLRGGAEMYRILGGGHTTDRMLRLDDYYLGRAGRVALFVCTGVFFAAAYLVQGRVKGQAVGGMALGILFALTSIAIVAGSTHQDQFGGQFQGLLIWSVPLAAVLVGFSLGGIKGLLQISRAKWALAITFLVFPYVYAFGTSANYWVSASLAGIFWIFSGFVLLTPLRSTWGFSSVLLSLGLGAQLVSVVLIQNGMETPYRQPQPLRYNDYRLEVGRPGAALVLSKGFGQHYADANTTAQKAGFKPGTPIIDLTGQSPGILYAIGAINIGQPWTVGGYPGSEALAIAMLRKVRCQELAMAWLLVEPEGPRKISSQILFSFGMNMATDFEVAGNFFTAADAGGYKEARNQKLYKPIRSVEVSTAACAAGLKVSK